ncbi:hypothetical protein ACVWW6_000293 [Bradyrhizobium sp. USDA 3311]
MRLKRGAGKGPERKWMYGATNETRSIGQVSLRSTPTGDVSPVSSANLSRA